MQKDKPRGTIHSAADTRQTLQFQLVFTFLTLNFLIPSVVYVLAPQAAIGQFDFLGRLLGGGSYPWAAAEGGFVWRVLAAGNVMTLGVMCLLLQLNLKKFYPVLWPLVFMKSFASLGFLTVFIATRYPAFLAVSLYDGLTVAAMIFFTRRAHQNLAPC